MPEENLIPGTTSTGAQQEIPTPEPTFTKSQVNELMQKRVNRSHQSFFNRYGVKDLQQLDDLVGKAGSYDSTKEKLDKLNVDYEDLVGQHKDLAKRYGYKMHNINPDKYADIETYFKGKGIDIDENSLLDEIKTHPDWVNQVTTIQNLGAEATPGQTQDEATIASEIFGVDLTQ